MRWSRSMASVLCDCLHRELGARLDHPAAVGAFASMSSPVSLVLDDVHALHEDQGRGALLMLADHVPDGSRLTLAGRCGSRGCVPRAGFLRSARTIRPSRSTGRSPAARRRSHPRSRPLQRSASAPPKHTTGDPAATETASFCSRAEVLGSRAGVRVSPSRTHVRMTMTAAAPRLR